ncbi:ROK family transcriptional regulator [Pseudoduganella namucuonensis]|uniref:Sugar kinase of the NBD/HSP70 family, may contain an N-terminal HTH domain n=1 Tax=Pseudoduganella namucuonensis TaxID=1035707 RepID=A0A1I7LB51_9BURK|nr:ROK family transcriptional regulator [Pseudoduganella namucuonensis]SFV06953.1 Sugar kinase of the NBD/HSP70 family, may contain an N-terminal HTH domain [Pseudoduganella namucuonensis]
MQNHPAPDDSLRPRGSNQTGMRQFNERVVLQAIRLNGSLPKADLARLTTLSTQTVSLIINRLFDDGLVVKRAPLRGKIGQPSVPIALNPDGAYAIGVKIGRRSLDVLLLDFTGAVRARHSQAYRFPDPELVFEAIAAQVGAMRAALSAEARGRIHGIGVAAPLSLGSWQELMGVAPDEADRWNRLDIARRIEAGTGLPVMFAKDTAAACVAELVAGRGRSVKSFLYLFVDTFIGGGLVIDSNLYAGMNGNAGAVGSLPVGVAGPGRAAPPQLLSAASLLGLERMFEQAGLDPAAAYDERAMQGAWAAHSLRWAGHAAAGVAMAVASASCMLDPEGVIIDGSCSRALLERLMADVSAALGRYDWEGVQRPQVLAGTIGSDARALGGALLPLYANFAPDRDVFLKLED